MRISVSLCLVFCGVARGQMGQSPKAQILSEESCVVRPTQALGSDEELLGSAVSAHGSWAVSVGAEVDAATQSLPLVVFQLRADNRASYLESWEECQRLFPFREMSVLYGRVLITEDYLFASDIWDLCAGTMSGAVYVYRRDDAGTPDDSNDDTWLEDARICALIPRERDNFGASLAYDGITLAVGASFDPIVPNQFSERGAVYIFERSNNSGSGEWVQKQKLVPSDGVGFDDFGGSVSLSGDKLVIGAELQRSSAYLDTYGAAYVYRRGASNWTQSAKFTPSASHIKHFGQRVLVRDDLVLVSVIGTWDVYAAGEVRVYHYVNNSWSLLQVLEATDRTTDDRFGASISFDGTWALIGATGRNSEVGVSNNEGAMYLYEAQAGKPWTERAIYRGRGLPPNAQLGVATALSDSYAFAASVHGLLNAYRLHDWHCFAGDFDADQDVDLFDVGEFFNCFSGNSNLVENNECQIFDFDENQIISLEDFAHMTYMFTSP